MAKEIPLNELDPRLQKQVQAAKKAAGSGDKAYAIEICMNILKSHPACLDVRKVLHEARTGKGGGKAAKGMTRFLNKVTSAPFSLKAKGSIEKDPAAVMTQAEEMLNSSPQNAVALKALGDAASAMELWHTAAFAYEEYRKQEPQDTEVLNALGKAYIEAKEPQKAVNAAARVLQANPADETAQDLMRRASVAQTMDKGRWEEEGNFREKIKDTEEATKLEQQSRVANDEETLRELIAETEQKVNNEPENMGYYRQIANWYRKLEDYGKALEWVKKAQAQPAGSSDTSLERLAYDLDLAQRRQKLEKVEAQLEENPDDPEAKKAYEEAQAEMRSFRLKNVAQMVDRYPNDFDYKYEYGVLLLENGEYDKAIQQLQRAQRSPKSRINALVNLGRALKAKNIKDMAAEQFVTAKKEVTQMNDLKKEIIYELATTYEEMGKKNEAIEEYKTIYAADIGYKDVADKINAFYSQQS